MLRKCQTCGTRLFGRKRKYCDKRCYPSMTYAARKKYTGPYSRTETGRYKSYQQGAKLRGVEFSLTETQFKSLWQLPCSYCGDPIDTIGIDRVDNSIGYIVSNITPCCGVCNRMKQQKTVAEFKNHVKKMVDYMKL